MRTKSFTQRRPARIEPRRILVPVDFSDSSARALRHAAKRAAEGAIAYSEATGRDDGTSSDSNVRLTIPPDVARRIRLVVERRERTVRETEDWSVSGDVRQGRPTERDIECVPPGRTANRAECQ